MTGRPSASLSPRAGMMVKTQAHAASLRFALLVSARGLRDDASAVGAPVVHQRLPGGKDSRRGKGTRRPGRRTGGSSCAPARRRSQSGIALRDCGGLVPEVAASMNCSIA
jgi:hypothetical protein